VQRTTTIIGTTEETINGTTTETTIFVGAISSHRMDQLWIGSLACGKLHLKLETNPH
jgi:hypothetical protein